ncbi:hypothetical protein ACXJY6_07690 [Vibrio sp. RC27]
MSHSFYEQLIQNPTFCEKLGRLTLMANQLESVLKSLIKSAGITKKLDKATLGVLKQICEDNEIIDDGVIEDLIFIHTRRNYLIHNLFPLFNEEIDVTLLPRDNLSELDAEHYFPECVEILIDRIQYVLSDLSVQK